MAENHLSFLHVKIIKEIMTRYWQQNSARIHVPCEICRHHVSLVIRSISPSSRPENPKHCRSRFTINYLNKNFLVEVRANTN